MGQSKWNLFTVFSEPFWKVLKCSVAVLFLISWAFTSSMEVVCSRLILSSGLSGVKITPKSIFF